MSAIEITFTEAKAEGIIALKGSKSISNRVLMIRALSGTDFVIDNLSDSDDTRILDQLLNSGSDVYDVQHGGTTFRFLTAYLALQPGDQVLTGSERMKQRPIQPLVEALNYLGADIEYLEVTGYPPLLIKSPKSAWKNQVSLPANISSQYISALMMIAPALKDGLNIELTDNVVSEPYIDMTLSVMQDFGIEILRTDNLITIQPQQYKVKNYAVESDWSSAAYYYLIASIVKEADITVKGLYANSIQGDAEIVQIGESFGIVTEYTENQIRILKSGDSSVPDFFEYNFIKTPDLVQTVSVMCAAHGVQGLFSGLQTLKIKETDRIKALKNELCKVQVALIKMPENLSKQSQIEYYLQEGKATFPDGNPVFITYDDHRMAMCLAPLSALHPIVIQHPEVTGKSYPNFWKDLNTLKFSIKACNK